MTIHCYNLISFLGNAKVKAQVTAWSEQLSAATFELKDRNHTPLIAKVLLGENDSNRFFDTGCEWINADEDSLTAQPDEIALCSSWHRPSELEKMLACLLYKLDKRVVVRNSYNCEDGSWGVAYTTPVSATDAYSQFVTVEQDEDGDDMESKMLEAEQELLVDIFLDDMPDLTKVIKKHLPHLDLE